MLKDITSISKEIELTLVGLLKQGAKLGFDKKLIDSEFLNELNQSCILLFRLLINHQKFTSS